MTSKRSNPTPEYELKVKTKLIITHVYITTGDHNSFKIGLCYFCFEVGDNYHDFNFTSSIICTNPGAYSYMEALGRLKA